MNNLTAVSPIEGRYKKILDLSEYFSEYALVKLRLYVEIEYLIVLSKNKVIRKISDEELLILKNIHKKFNLEEAKQVIQIEKTTNHDVKAVELYLRNKIEDTSLKDLTEFVHFGLTSSDINNIAYSLMIKQFLENIYVPTIKQLLRKLLDLVEETKDIPMLARTHGQPASPTTFGKEIAVFMDRLTTQVSSLKQIKLTAKLNGATGNYNAHMITYPDIDWQEFSSFFIKSLDLKPNEITTQIEPRDNLANLFHNIIRINNILLDLSKDMWLYISQNYLIQETVKAEVGSSTMPHKVNPIDFENCEGNLGLANVILSHLANKLPISRMQRDLSCSTVMRNIGVGFAHSIIAYKSCFKGLNKIKPNNKAMLEDLRKHPEILTEAIQTILKKQGVVSAYEEIKKISRGKSLSQEEINTLLSKHKMQPIKPEEYIGLAEKLAQKAINKTKKFL